jgi:isopropylmalate/homocitrate/citramalate synthase
MEFNFESSIRGYHVYKSIWTYEISEKLRCDREENNANDKFAVKLVRKMEIKNTCPSNSAKYLNFS